MPYYQLGSTRFSVPTAVGVTPQCYTQPLSLPAGILRVNYVQLGITGGNVNTTLELYVTPVAANLRAEAATQILTTIIAPAAVVTRLPLAVELRLVYGGDYALIWVFTYAAGVTTPIRGPARALSPEVPCRIDSLLANPNMANPFNWDGTAPAGYNNMPVYNTPTFYYGLPWCELYYCDHDDGGAGAPPTSQAILEPAKVGVTP